MNNKMLVSLFLGWVGWMTQSPMARMFANYQKGRAGKSNRKVHWTQPHQGKKECERRLRQIECGMLTESNGLERQVRTLHLGKGALYMGDKELGAFTNASIQLGCA